MAPGRPTWPGTRPEVAEFPFDVATAAAQQARALSADLDRLRRRMGSEDDVLAHTEFRGHFARWFSDTGREAEGDLAVLVDRLEEQAEVVEALVRSAHRRVDQDQARVRRWAGRYRAWRDWTQPTGSGP